jgi:ATP-dependent helicase/nuclease subunit A
MACYFDDDKGPFVSFSAKGDDEPIAEARNAHKDRMLGEHWRLLYVAMTRARDRLIVCGPQWRNSEAPNVSWRAAVHEALEQLGAEKVETPFGEGLRLGAPVIADAQVLTAQDAVALPAWARAPVPGAARIEIAAPSRLHRIDPALFSPRGDGQKRFRRGRLIHGLLERLPEIAVDKREASAHAWLQRQGVEEGEAGAFVREALSVITEARFAAVFSAASRAEAPIIGDVRGKAIRGVVDRLAVEKNRVLVLDFKTDRPAPTDVAEAPDAYVMQLALYREVLRKIFPGKSVSCALLWTEKPHLMELPDSRLDAVFATFA